MLAASAKWHRVRLPSAFAEALTSVGFKLSFWKISTMIRRDHVNDDGAGDDPGPGHREALAEMTDANEHDDAELLRRWQSGDRRAGEQLVRRHHASIHRFFLNKLGRAAEDLVQETFFGLLKGLSRFRSEASVRTMIFAIAHNKLVDQLRAEARHPFNPAVSSIQDSMRSPPSLLEIHEQHKLLVAALRQLPLEIQCMLELHYWESMPIKEIARILDIPDNTVKTRMRCGRQELEVAMQRLARSAEQLVTTRRGLEGWSEELKREVEELCR